MWDLIIVGGGASGLYCAIAAKKQNISKVLVLEKDPQLGGLLNLADFNISSTNVLTGLEYKEKLMYKFNALDIMVQLNTHVISLNEQGHLICVSSEHGMQEISAKAVILANGAKEKGRNVMNLTGDRSPGVMTMLNAKKVIKNEKLVPGKEIVIYGADHLYMLNQELPNLNIKAVIGDVDQRYLVDCDVEIYHNYHITQILGSNRVEQIVMSNHEHEVTLECDCVILAQGLLSDGLVAFRSGIALNPETTGPTVDEHFQTSRPHVYACGNGIYVHEYIEEIEAECDRLIEFISLNM